MIYQPYARLCAVALVGMLSCLAVLGQHTKEQAFQIIKQHVDSYKPKGADASNICLTVHCCDMTKGSSCDLSTFPKDSTSLVYPGGDTRCIYSYSSEYAFQVIRGAANDKVILYFQGGGACFDEVSTNIGFCTSDATPADIEGVFDHSNSDNPYKDYTVVIILYCSGDLHAGNVTRDYTDDDGVPISQQGISNVRSVLAWVSAQQQSGQLAHTFTDFLVMGASAGAIGTQIWSEMVLTDFSWSNAAVIADSYAGVFPDGTQGPLIYDYNACEIVDESLQASCNAETLTLQDITYTAMSQINAFSSHVPYTFVQSKADAVQISFYIAVGALTPDSTATITQEEFYADVNVIFERYNPLPNFVTYLVDGNKHQFTNYNVMYTADLTGPTGDGATGTPTLVSWLNLLPLTSGSSVTTDCHGEELPQADWSGTDYCDEALLPKSYAYGTNSRKMSAHLRG